MSVATATQSQPVSPRFKPGDQVVLKPSVTWSGISLGGMIGTYVGPDRGALRVSLLGAPIKEVVVLVDELDPLVQPTRARLTEVQEGGKRFYALRSVP